MRVAIIVARAVDCCVGVALASGRAALWVALERRAQWVVLVGILAWPLRLNAKGAYHGACSPKSSRRARNPEGPCVCLPKLTCLSRRWMESSLLVQTLLITAHTNSALTRRTCEIGPHPLVQTLLITA